MTGGPEQLSLRSIANGNATGYLGQAVMTSLNLQQPLTFRPIFQERIWGGRRLQELYRKRLPADVKIGESWEIVDRPEAQSLIANGPLAGWSLHQCWSEHRTEIFGTIAGHDRFPLLIKLLDARSRLSLQVHPPTAIAKASAGESKTEFWYVADADVDAEIFVGLKEGSSRQRIEEALADGSVAGEVHRLPIRAGDSMFLPSGRIHAIGAGNVIIEIQENSDTTYRVFDWNRLDDAGTPRKLHLEESMRSINFEDHAPALVQPQGESLVRHSLFAIERWALQADRSAGPRGRFVIIACLSGEIDCAGIILRSGEFFLLPATVEDRILRPRTADTALLHVTIPEA